MTYTTQDNKIISEKTMKKLSYDLAKVMKKVSIYQEVWRMKELESVRYLCIMIVQGVANKDRDSVRSHLEDLNNFLMEKNLLAEWGW